MKSFLQLMSISLLCFFVSTTIAQTHLTANLTGAQEVPAVSTTASGTAVFNLTPAGLEFDITVQGLTITGAHFHNAATGVNGGVVHAITGEFVANTASGIWTTAEGLTQALRNDLLAGKVYVNIHTAANPGGEIRGQLRVSAGTGLTAVMNGAQEVPPVATAATGTGSFTLTEEGLAFSITLNGLAFTAAHFHNAAAGSNGSVVRDIFADFSGNTASGVWRSTDAQPLTSTLIAELLAGNIYVNAHTPANPGGEIRGQILINNGTSFTAGLDGNEEATAVVTSATGTGSFELTAAGLDFDITVQGLTITGAHFHNAATGVNGGVVHAITGEFINNTASGTWTPAEGLSTTLINELMAGNIYVNIHTAANPGGEIRGQVLLSAGQGFSASFDGAQQVPPVATSASATGAFTLTPEGLVWHVTVTGLTLTLSHFHNAPLGSNGPVVRDIGSSYVNNTAVGVWRSSDAEPLSASAQAELLAGNIYCNIHTAAFPNGEVRGQLEPTLAAVCSSANPPTMQMHTQDASKTVLSWTPISQAVACQVNGKRLPTGPTPSVNVNSAPYNSVNVPHSVAGAGTMWTWRVRCACSIPPNPLDVSPFTVYGDTFMVPLLRQEIETPGAAIALWPNPANEYINVSSDDENVKSVKVIDALGSTILEYRDINAHNFIGTDVSGLSEGIYFLEVKTGTDANVLQFSVVR